MADLALLLLRLWLALVMLAHGANHARSLDGTTRWFAGLGFRHPRAQAVASSVGELAVGAGLALGLLTAPAVAGLVATMAVAFWTVHRHAGFFVFARPDEGWEYVATLVVAALVLAILGPGAWSLDAVLGVAESLDGTTGLVVALAGLVGAAAIVVADHRPE
jgi:putative oxidoreductase